MRIVNARDCPPRLPGWSDGPVSGSASSVPWLRAIPIDGGGHHVSKSTRVVGS
jgi:hypothetical protein